MITLTEIEASADGSPREGKEELAATLAEDEGDGGRFRQGR